MDALDPLCAISSPTRLLPRTLGPAPAQAPTTSPWKAREALLESIARQLKGSEELAKQARMVLNEHGDIQMLYHDDGVKACAQANGKKEQQGRRPALDRKRGRFTMKDNTSKMVPVVDKSKLSETSDPLEYFKTLDRLEEAEKEVQHLKGEVPDKNTLNFEPVDEPKRRPGLPGRKSIRTFALIEDDDAQYPIEASASQAATMTESQLSQDAMHAVTDKNEQSAPSRSGEHAMLDVSEKEVSVSEKDDHDQLTYLLTSFQNLDESEEEDFIRKTLGIQQIRKEKVSLRDSILGDRSLRNNTVPESSTMVCPPERPLPQSCQDRISELEKHLFPGDTANDKCTDLLKDDESEGSPDTAMGELSYMHDSSVVLMTNEFFTGSEIDRETQNLGVRATENVSDPEPNMRECADERQAGGSPLAKEKEHDMPIRDPTIGRSNNNETEVSSHHLEGISTEVSVSTPGTNMAPDGIDKTSHAAEDNIQHLEVVKEDGVLQDKSSHPLEMPPEAIDPLNQSEMHGGNIKNMEADTINSVVPTKQKKQQAAQKGKKKRQSKRSQGVAGITSCTSSENMETDAINALAPSKEKKQQASQKGKKKQQSKRSQDVADESSHPLETAQENFDSENQPHTDDVNIEQQTATSNALSPNKAKGQKGAQKRYQTKKLNRRESIAGAGLAWQSGVRRSTRIRSRPLEHWLGERFLYGRIHDTMTTVIGIKAYSPGEDGKKTLKVKSFVPEQYSDIVAESAKY